MSLRKKDIELIEDLWKRDVPEKELIELINSYEYGCPDDPINAKEEEWDRNGPLAHALRVYRTWRYKNVEAVFELAHDFQEGRGCKRDLETAHTLYLWCARRGHKDAQIQCSLYKPDSDEVSKQEAGYYYVVSGQKYNNVKQLLKTIFE